MNRVTEERLASEVPLRRRNYLYRIFLETVRGPASAAQILPSRRSKSVRHARIAGEQTWVSMGDSGVISILPTDLTAICDVKVNT